MQVLICGAGQVGYSIARYLSNESTDVTLVDLSEELIAKALDSLDVRGVVGHASYPTVLAQAGAADADMIIAVTQSDEVNMVACQVAHSLFNITTKIARIRQSAYSDPKWSNMFTRDHMPIDLIISPEQEVARAIRRRLEVPGAFDIIPMGGGAVSIVGVRCVEDTPILDTPLNKLDPLFPDLAITVLFIERNGEKIVPKGDEILLVGDEVYLALATEHLKRGLAVFGHEETEGRRVLIVGGGNIGSHLGQLLEEERPDVRVKLIELDKNQAKRAAQNLSKTVVLHGDALDPDILTEASVSQTETIVAVSNDDEVNILVSLLAKRHGCQRAVTLVNKRGYGNLISQLGIEAIVNPRAITVSHILQFVRQGLVRSVHTLAEGVGEVIEVEAMETSGIVGKTLSAAKISKGIRLGMIVRGDSLISPRGDTVIEPHDRVVLFATADTVKKVEKLFTVSLEFF